MKCIELNKGHVAIVDDEDFERLAQYRWTVNVGGYAVRNIKLGINQWKMVYMHREVVSPPPGKVVDHKNLNKLDNRKGNLRFATPFQNAQNSPRFAATKTGYKGVERIGSGRYSARITANGVRRYLGSYDTEEEAFTAYTEAARLYHGEFHRLN